MKNIVAQKKQATSPALIAWGIYVFLQPFYVFTSGLPQPGDMFVIVLLPLVMLLWDGRLKRDHLRALHPLLWFTLWALLVNLAWAIALGRYGFFGTNNFLMYPMYYVYNTLVFVCVLILIRRHDTRFLRVTLYSLYAAILAQVLASLTAIGGSARGAVFFNNPNQLGYFALLAACVMVLLHWRLKLRLLLSGTALTSCAWLALASASRSALAGILILLVVLLFANPRIIVAASIAAIGLVLLGGPISEAINISEKRARRVSQMGFLEERGYDRIWKNKQYLVLGAGEGGLGRFVDSPEQKQMEMHSSAGTILFSYGIVGVILFIAFMLRVLRGASWRYHLVLLPPLIYAVAHQSLRFTLLWILLAIFVATKDRKA